MSFLSVLLIILYVLVCIFLILVVLLQQGKGADLAGAFGGGGSQTSFGPRTSTNIMHRLTTISFVAFVVLSITLAILAGRHRGQSVISDEPTPTPVPADAPAEPGLSATEEGTAAEGTAGEGEQGTVAPGPETTELEAPATGDTGDDSAAEQPAEAEQTTGQDAPAGEETQGEESR